MSNSKNKRPSIGVDIDTYEFLVKKSEKTGQSITKHIRYIVDLDRKYDLDSMNNLPPWLYEMVKGLSSEERRKLIKKLLELYPEDPDFEQTSQTSNESEKKNDEPKKEPDDLDKEKKLSENLFKCSYREECNPINLDKILCCINDPPKKTYRQYCKHCTRTQKIKPENSFKKMPQRLSFNSDQLKQEDQVLIQEVKQRREEQYEESRRTIPTHLYTDPAYCSVRMINIKQCWIYCPLDWFLKRENYPELCVKPTVT